MALLNDKAKYKRGWKSGLPETECGSGSRIGATVMQREWIPQVIARYQIESVADIGAGDLNWMKHIELTVPYQAYDLVPRHADVKQFDLLNDTVPDADCLMCIYVLNHFPDILAAVALKRLVWSKARWLVMQYSDNLAPFLNLPYVDSVTIQLRKAARGDVDLRLHDLNELRGEPICSRR